MAGKTGALCFETIDHAGSKMLCVGGGGAITTTEDFVAVKQRLNERHSRARDGVRERFRGGDLGLNAFGKSRLLILSSTGSLKSDNTLFAKGVFQPLDVVAGEGYHIETAIHSIKTPILSGEPQGERP